MFFGLNDAAFLAAAAAPAVPTDPDFASVSLLLPMDGADGSTTFTDRSSNSLTVTAFGDAQISTAQSKFGGASGLFDGSGDYLSVADDVAIQLGSGDFTIEFWFYLPTGAAKEKAFMTIGTWPTNTQAFLLYYGGAGEVAIYVSTSTFFWQISDRRVTTSPAADQWHHLAITRGGTTFRGFFNGTKSVEFTYSSALTTGPLTIASGASGSNAINARIDDLRITKGVARYTGNFTPPTAPFPDS
jgi:hypothetical protein